jgi:hypothetical protein
MRRLAGDELIGDGGLYASNDGPGGNRLIVCGKPKGVSERDRPQSARAHGHKGAGARQIIDVAGGDYDVDPLLRTGYLRIHRERIAETTGSRFGSDEYLT